jgi:hypothetical protein
MELANCHRPLEPSSSSEVVDERSRRYTIGIRLSRGDRVSLGRWEFLEQAPGVVFSSSAKQGYGSTMSHSAIGQTILSVELLVDHEIAVGNGLFYLCDAAGHQWTVSTDGVNIAPQWSKDLAPNGVWQQWLKSPDGTTASATFNGQVVKVSYSAAAPNS